MADNKPLTIQRELSRLDSQEDNDMLRWRSGGYVAAVGKTTKYSIVILIVLSVLSILSVFLLWALANTVYTPMTTQKLNDPLVDALFPNDTVLVQRYNPFYIESVSVSSDENDLLIWQVLCRKLSYGSQDILDYREINNITKHAYEIGSYYLPKGTMNVNVTFQLKHGITNDTVLSSLYIYNKKSEFDDFLQNGPNKKKNSSYDIETSPGEVHFALKELQNFIGLFIPDTQIIYEVNYTISGEKTAYDPIGVKPTCTMTPTTNGLCVINFSNPHINSKQNEVCILGRNMGGEFSSLELKVKGNGYVNRISFILVELSFGVCGGLILVNMLIALCVCLVRESGYVYY